MDNREVVFKNEKGYMQKLQKTFYGILISTAFLISVNSFAMKPSATTASGCAGPSASTATAAAMPIAGTQPMALADKPAIPGLSKRFGELQVSYTKDSLRPFSQVWPLPYSSEERKKILQSALNAIFKTIQDAKEQRELLKELIQFTISYHGDQSSQSQKEEAASKSFTLQDLVIPFVQERPSSDHPITFGKSFAHYLSNTAAWIKLRFDEPLKKELLGQLSKLNPFSQLNLFNDPSVQEMHTVISGLIEYESNMKKQRDKEWAHQKAQKAQKDYFDALQTFFKKRAELMATETHKALKQKEIASICQEPTPGEELIPFDRELTINGKEGVWARSIASVDETHPFPMPHGKSEKVWPENKKKQFLYKLWKLEKWARVSQMRGTVPLLFDYGAEAGEGEYYYNGYTWPTAYSNYYINKYNVLPSREFYRFVENSLATE
jgi:hypothetical protein